MRKLRDLFLLDATKSTDPDLPVLFASRQPPTSPLTFGNIDVHQATLFFTLLGFAFWAYCAIYQFETRFVDEIHPIPLALTSFFILVCLLFGSVFRVPAGYVPAVYFARPLLLAWIVLLLAMVIKPRWYSIDRELQTWLNTQLLIAICLFCVLNVVAHDFRCVSEEKRVRTLYGAVCEELDERKKKRAAEKATNVAEVPIAGPSSQPDWMEITPA
ncbi:hypothetical protein M3Y99_01220600 [Aphelenchoides fujianensis]|nr:hypothetical protein M3Y99_01220600 [Aphelenchoides fujianensis]